MTRKITAKEEHGEQRLLRFADPAPVPQLLLQPDYQVGMAVPAAQTGKYSHGTPGAEASPQRRERLVVDPATPRFQDAIDRIRERRDEKTTCTVPLVVVGLTPSSAEQSAQRDSKPVAKVLDTVAVTPLQAQ